MGITQKRLNSVVVGRVLHTCFRIVAKICETYYCVECSQQDVTWYTIKYIIMYMITFTALILIVAVCKYFKYTIYSTTARRSNYSLVA